MGSSDQPGEVGSVCCNGCERAVDGAAVFVGGDSFEFICCDCFFSLYGLRVSPNLKPMKPDPERAAIG